MKTKAHHIRKRFPDKGRSIDLLLAEAPEFPSLCEDYDACVDALRYWVNSNEPEAQNRVAEYRTLIQELEDEIDQAFAAIEPQHPD